MKITRLLNLPLKAFKAGDNKVISGNNNRANKIVVNLFKNNKFRSLTHMPIIKAIKKSIFLTSMLKRLLTIYSYYLSKLQLSDILIW